jgi:MtaA/CmuA family methyltransferase
MATMTGRQRYFAMLEGAECDFVPRLPILMRYAAERAGADYGSFTADYRVLTRANAACAAEFGIDQMNTMSDPYREATGFGAVCHHEPEAGARIAEPPLAGGELTARRLAALPHPDPLATPRMRDRISAVEAYAAEHGGGYSVMGWVEGPAAEAADLRGVQEFFMDLLDEPELVGELMDRCNETALGFAQAQLDAGADTIGIGDAVASQVSPAVYGALILPREKWLVSAIKEYRPEAKVRLHICGDITHLLPGIATLGVDIVDIDHMVDMAAARRALGRRVALAGNIDPVAGVLRGTPGEIRRHVEATYALVGNPFMVNAGCEIPSGTPPENLSALCQPLPWQP